MDFKRYCHKKLVISSSNETMMPDTKQDVLDTILLLLELPFNEHCSKLQKPNSITCICNLFARA